MKRIPIATTILTLLLLPLAAVAATPPEAAPLPLQVQTQNGIRFLSGGVGQDEQHQIARLGRDYSVRVALTAPGGAYLSDVNVVIEDAAGKPLVQTTTQGPILFAQLAPGHYRLQASSQGRRTEQRMIDVPKAGSQVRLYVALPGAAAPVNAHAKS